MTLSPTKARFSPSKIGDILSPSPPQIPLLLPKDNIPPKMLLFAIPVMLTSILQLLFNAADIIVVGRFAGDNSLAAVGSNSSLIGLMTNLFVGISIGTNVLVSRYFGSKNDEGISKAVSTSILVAIFSGIFLTILGVVFARKILILMHTPAEVLGLATLYLVIYFFGMTPMMIYNFGAAVLRASGDTRRPLFYLSVAGVINVILNLFFVIYLHLDVAGVAIATVISQCVSAALVLRCLSREAGPMRLTLKGARIDLENLLKILRIGIPAGLQGVLFSFSNVVIQSSINTFGATVMAGSSASTRSIACSLPVQDAATGMSMPTTASFTSYLTAWSQAASELARTCMRR